MAMIAMLELWINREFNNSSKFIEQAEIWCLNLLDPLEEMPYFDTNYMSSNLRVIVYSYKDDDLVHKELETPFGQNKEW